MTWKTDGLTFCQSEKRDFVQDKLLPLLADVDKHIESVKYQVSEHSGTEYVIISYPERSDLTINVTHDSLLALCRDVFKKLG